MKQKIEKIINKLQNSYLDCLKFIIQLVFWAVILFFGLPFLAKLFTSLFKISIQLNDFILLITAAFIIAYTYETQKMKEQMKKQVELAQMPIVLLYVRNIQEYMSDIADYNEQQKYKSKYKNFLIRIRTENDNSNYYLALRNTGNGTAFNIEVKSDIFEVSKYQGRFLAPSKDEQPFAIVERGNKKIESWDKFQDSVFEISCTDINSVTHLFRYKITEIASKKVDFIEHKIGMLD